MAKIDLPKESGKRLKVREKSVKSQEILKWILSGNPGCMKSDCTFTMHSLNQNVLVHVTLLHLFS